VQAFLQDTLLTYCREAPPEFNEHQRDVFCVFSGVGVTRLRRHLNTDDEGTRYDHDADGITADTQGMAIDEEDGQGGDDSEMLG
jgi:F-box and leucine-rich repeat protein GRR1